jgi:hypothetical protein
VAQLVAHHLCKVGVAGSSPVVSTTECAGNWRTLPEWAEFCGAPMAYGGQYGEHIVSRESPNGPGGESFDPRSRILGQVGITAMLRRIARAIFIGGRCGHAEPVVEPAGSRSDDGRPAGPVPEPVGVAMSVDIGLTHPIVCVVGHYASAWTMRSRPMNWVRGRSLDHVRVPGANQRRPWFGAPRRSTGGRCSGTRRQGRSRAAGSISTPRDIGGERAIPFLTVTTTGSAWLPRSGSPDPKMLWAL